MNYSADIQKLPRIFLPEDFVVTNWEGLEPYFNNLDQREIKSLTDLEQWLKDASELEAVISEDACWRQIKMTCDQENTSLEQSFLIFIMDFQPMFQSYSVKFH